MWTYTYYVSDSITDRLSAHFDYLFSQSNLQKNTGNNSCVWSFTDETIGKPSAPVKVEFQDATPTQIIISSSSLESIRSTQALVGLFIEQEESLNKEAW